MLSDYVIEKLKASWGDKANALSCYAEVRLFDPESSWECYVIACNPACKDEIYCIVKAGKTFEPYTCEWSLEEIYNLFNSQGEGVSLDKSYRPIWASDLFKKLKT